MEIQKDNFFKDAEEILVEHRRTDPEDDINRLMRHSELADYFSNKLKNRLADSIRDTVELNLALPEIFVNRNISARSILQECSLSNLNDGMHDGLSGGGGMIDGDGGRGVGRGRGDGGGRAGQVQEWMKQLIAKWNLPWLKLRQGHSVSTVFNPTSPKGLENLKALPMIHHHLLKETGGRNQRCLLASACPDYLYGRCLHKEKCPKAHRPPKKMTKEEQEAIQECQKNLKY